MDVKEVLKRIKKKEKISEQDLKALVSECEIERKRRFGVDFGQRTRVVSIVCIVDEFYAIYWQEGIVDLYDDVFDGQPVRVFPEKVTITEWRNKFGVPI